MDYKSLSLVKEAIPSDYYFHLFAGVSVYDPMNDPQYSVFVLNPGSSAVYYGEKYRSVNIGNSMIALAEQFKNTLNEINTNIHRNLQEEHIKALEIAYETAVRAMSEEFVSLFINFAKKCLSREMSYTDLKIDMQTTKDIAGMFYNVREHILTKGSIDSTMCNTITGNSQTLTYSDIIALDNGLKSEILSFIRNPTSWTIEGTTLKKIKDSNLGSFANRLFTNMIKETSRLRLEEEVKTVRSNKNGTKQGNGINSLPNRSLLKIYQLMKEYEMSNPDPLMRMLPLHVPGSMLIGKSIDIYS